MVRVWAKVMARPWPPSDSRGPAETRPRDGLSPMPPHQAAGMRIEPPMSEPWASGTSPALTAAAPPPVEPPADRPDIHGVWVAP